MEYDKQDCPFYCFPGAVIEQEKELSILKSTVQEMGEAVKEVEERLKTQILINSHLEEMLVEREGLLDDCLSKMIEANNLIHKYKFEPDSIYNDAKQVDPVIHNLRVTISKLEDQLGRTTLGRDYMQAKEKEDG